MTTTSAPPTKTPDDTTQEGLGARALRRCSPSGSRCWPC